MGFELEQDDDYAQRRLQQLESRFRRAQFVLAGAQVQYSSLRHAHGASQSELTQALNRIRRAREQLNDILSTIEFLEDQHCVAPVVQRVDDTPNAAST
jgi:chromosome segregation ATPase